MNELLESLACAGTECFSWILVLLNIFAVFYLVFCSFWKTTGLVKIFGWIYSGVLICAVGATLFYHTCIYTLLATVFTGMMIMAILSLILPRKTKDEEKTDDLRTPKPLGAYVISETYDGWFVFGIYDQKRRKLINSTYAYASCEKAREAILACQENGPVAETEDNSGDWLQEKSIPKFKVCKYGSKYGFSLYILDEDSIIHSEKFDKLSLCLSSLKKVKQNIGATEIYISVDKINGDGYKKYEQLPATEPKEEAFENKENDGETVKGEEEAPSTFTTEVDSSLFIDINENPEEYKEMQERENRGEIRIVFRFKKSFKAKLSQSQGNVQNYYNELKNALLSYKGIKSRMSWNCESFNKGRAHIAKMEAKPKTLFLYLALSPSELAGTKYGVIDASLKKRYATTPSLMKIKGERKLKHALELIEKLCADEHKLPKQDIEAVDYKVPYMTNEEMVEKGIVKHTAGYILLTPKNEGAAPTKE